MCCHSMWLSQGVQLPLSCRTSGKSGACQHLAPSVLALQVSILALAVLSCLPDVHHPLLKHNPCSALPNCVSVLQAHFD